MKYTYLFFRASDGLTKIGRTAFPRQRFEQLGGDKFLQVIAVIEGDHEKLLHAKHAESRYAGEWFSLSAEIIAEYRETHGGTFPSCSMTELPQVFQVQLTRTATDYLLTLAMQGVNLKQYVIDTLSREAAKKGFKPQNAA